MKKLILTIIAVAALLTTMAGLIIPVKADVLCEGVTGEMRKRLGCDENDGKKLNKAIISIVNTVVGLAALVAVVFIIIGGINYMTSAGDAGKIAKAKLTIMYAVIGLIVCALAFVIVNFAINAINGKSKGATGDKQPTTTKNVQVLPE